MDLVARLRAAAEAAGADLACARSDGRSHPVFGLWPLRLYEELRHALMKEEIRKVDLWTARYKLVEVDFPTNPIDPFFNTNRPEDLAEAERLLATLP
jgi:molybdopterin-guanine dinucleotide biosynthesis protein A